MESQSILIKIKAALKSSIHTMQYAICTMQCNADIWKRERDDEKKPNAQINRADVWYIKRINGEQLIWKQIARSFNIVTTLFWISSFHWSVVEF